MLQVVSWLYALSLRVCECLSLFVVVLLSFTLECRAVDIDLAWNANPEGNIAGYRLYVRTGSGTFGTALNPGAQTSFHFANADSGTTYHFAVTAYNSAGFESPRSEEFTIVTPARSGGGGTNGPDSDGDGLSDADELIFGTDPNNPDTDGDGTLDGQEVTDGTSPLDRGSAAPLLSTRFCGEWNGFLNGMWNILELVNVGITPLTGQVVLYSSGGAPLDSRQFFIQQGGQQDVLVHDFPGRQANSYGKICIEHDGGVGALDGRMVYYKTETVAGNPRQFQFAFAMPFTNGRTGSQFVPFNTFQPSGAAGDANNLVANWIQLTNLAATDAQGTLTYYNMDGSTLGTERVFLSGGERRDFSGHRFGRNLVGIIGWIPDDAQQTFQLRNVRYIYDNPNGLEHFTTAFQLEGVYGSGQLMSVPCDGTAQSSILEISNVSDQSVTAAVQVYDSNGLQLNQRTIPLAPHATYHVILDSILQGRRGVATVQGSAAGSVIAVAMQYGRKANGGLNFMYGLPAREAVGSVMKGSYNTFIDQHSELWLSNPTGQPESVDFSVVRSDGSIVRSSVQVTVPAKGLRIVDINSYESALNYGVITAQVPVAKSLVAHIIRRKGTDYVMPTAVR